MSPPTRSAGRTWTWIGVLLLHAVLLWLLARSALPRREPAGPSTPPRVTLRVIPVAPEWSQLRSPTVATQLPDRRRPASQADRERAPDRTPDNPARNAAPEAITVRNAEAAPPAPPAASQPERLLDLKLRPNFASKPNVRDEALADPRANSRATPEARMAQALGGDGRLVEENLGDGRRRFYQNGRCMESRPSRASQLDPYSNVASPNLIGPC